MKKAAIQSIPKIIALLKESFSRAWKKTGRKIDEKFVKRELKNVIKNEITLIEEQNGKIAVFGWAKHSKDFFGNKFGEIKLILVSPKSQNKGLGTKMLTQLEKKLKQKDTRLDCLTNNPAKKLYKKQGYEKFLETLRKT